MLGLGDHVGGDVVGVGVGVGDDRDLRRPGLRVDADHAAHGALGGGHVDVARPGDHVDRLAQPQRVGGSGLARRPVGEHGHRLGAADGVHLLDAQHAADGQDRRVHESAGVLPRRAGQRDRLHAGHLGGHGVHDHRRGVGGQAARHVQSDPADRDPPLAHHPAGDDPRLLPGGHLRPVPGAVVGDRELEGLAQLGVEGSGRLLQGRGRHSEAFGPHPVEAFGEVAQGRPSALAHVVDDGCDGGRRRLDVECGAGQALAEFPRGEDLGTQVDATNHAL